MSSGPGLSQSSDGDTPATAGRVYRSAAAAVAIAWSMRLIGLVSVLVLARLLTPRDFGIVALASSVLALVDVFSALGLRQALLRIPAPERAHYDTAWTLQLLVLALLAGVLVGIAPLAAWFYQEPALAGVITVLAVCFVIDGLANIGVVDFERHLQFGRDLRMRLTVRLTGFAVTLTAALLLRNYWALVVGLVLTSTLNAIASYLFHPYRPRFSLARRKDLLGVSLWMFLAFAAQTVHSQIEKIVVGRISSRALLGFYAVSRDLSSIFTEEIATALNRVTFVTTAQTGRPLSDEPGRLAALLGAYALIAAPLGFGLAATAEPFLWVLLGPQWSGAAPYLGIIAPACALYAVHKLVVSILQASGDARAAAWLSGSGALLALTTTAGVAAAGYGAPQVAAAALGTAAVLLAGGVALLARKAAASPLVLLLSVARPFAAGVVMLLVLRAFDFGDLPPLARLVLEIAAGGILFVTAAATLWLAQRRPDGAERLFVAAVRQWSHGRLKGAAARA